LRKVRFFYELEAGIRQIDGRTDGRTGETHNAAAYLGRPHNNRRWRCADREYAKFWVQHYRTPLQDGSI